jgi:hypothetical protein
MRPHINIPRVVIFAFPNQLRPLHRRRLLSFACLLVTFRHARKVSGVPHTTQARRSGNHEPTLVVIKTMGVFNLLLLGLCAWFTWGTKSEPQTV